MAVNADEKPVMTVADNVTAAFNHMKGIKNDNTPLEDKQEEQPATEGEETLEEQIEPEKQPEKKQEPAKQPKAEKKAPAKEEAKPDKKEESKPDAKSNGGKQEKGAEKKPEEDAIPEFDYSAWAKEEEEKLTKSEKKEEEKVEEKPVEEKTEKKLSTHYTELAQKLGIEADTDEDFESEILKLKSSQPEQVDDYDQRIANLKTFADKSKVSDEELLKILYTHKYGEEEASQQIEDLREAQGDAGIRIAAREERGAINSEITRLETEKGSFRHKQEQAQKKFDTELATLVKTPTTIAGIPIETEAAKDLEYIKSKGFDKDLLKPENYVLAAKLFRNRDSILAKAKSISEPVAKKIYTKGANDMSNVWKQKVFNKDIDNKSANGRMPQATEKVTVESNVSKAKEHIQNRVKGAQG